MSFTKVMGSPKQRGVADEVKEVGGGQELKKELKGTHKYPS